MKFLALETDIEKLKKQFIVEGEEVLLTIPHHYFIFVFPFVLHTVFTVIAIALIIFVGMVVQGFWGLVTGGILFFLWALYYFYKISVGYIRWRYNYVVVSTRKVVIVEHRFVIYQNVFPIHLENISSTSFESQFLGFGGCGVLHLNLKEREGGSSRQINCPYIPKPDLVAGTIENAISLLSQKQEEGKKEGEQQEQIAAVKEKVEEQITPAGGTAS
jgi:hypothetical protein